MRKNRWVWAGAIVVVVLVLLSLIVPPNRTNLQHGSTYSRAPSGYGAWYAYMQEQGADIQRWQRPLDDLVQPRLEPEETPIEQEAVPIEYQPIEYQPSSSILSADSLTAHPITLLRVDNGQILDFPSTSWFEQGNVLIQLGVGDFSLGFEVDASVTEAPFTSVLESSVGGVKVETSRRLPPPRQPYHSVVLDDAYGVVIWETTIGKGRFVIAVTPYLAANAYQDEPGNFKLLEQLVTEAGNPIWVDEYLHGYKDQEVIAEETSRSLLNYLANTPIALVAVQAIVLLLVLIWGLNRRLGPPITLDNPKVDNSQSYIQALASVLHRANCSEFVVEAIGKAEQLQIQRSLGLGTDLLDPALVAEAWTQQTGRSASELEAVLRPGLRRHRLNESELLNWLGKMQRVRQQLP